MRDDLIAALTTEADPERAVGQQRYMRSEMPFHGVTMGDVRRIVGQVAAQHPLPDAATWRRTVRAIWDEATHREQRYAAIELLKLRRYRRWAEDPTPEYVELLRHLITDGAWWDLVDALASAVGALLTAQPTLVTPLMRQWAVDEDLWLRRVSIICQLGRRVETDLDLLTFAITSSIHDPDFFARKAIGWALREYSKINASWVREFVAEHSELSALSRREALKWLNRRDPQGLAFQ